MATTVLVLSYNVTITIHKAMYAAQSVLSGSNTNKILLM